MHLVLAAIDGVDVDLLAELPPLQAVECVCLTCTNSLLALQGSPASDVGNVSYGGGSSKRVCDVVDTQPPAKRVRIGS
jgi:hypothetical protein